MYVYNMSTLKTRARSLMVYNLKVFLEGPCPRLPYMCLDLRSQPYFCLCTTLLCSCSSTFIVTDQLRRVEIEW